MFETLWKMALLLRIRGWKPSLFRPRPDLSIIWLNHPADLSFVERVNINYEQKKWVIVPQWRLSSRTGVKIQALSNQTSLDWSWYVPFSLSFRNSRSYMDMEVFSCVFILSCLVSPPSIRNLRFHFWYIVGPSNHWSQDDNKRLKPGPSKIVETDFRKLDHFYTASYCIPSFRAAIPFLYESPPHGG